MTAKAKKIDPEISRRRFVTGALGLTGGVATVSLLSVIGGVRPVTFVTEDQKPVTQGDVLVYAEGDDKDKPIDPSKLKDGDVVKAYPKAKDVVKNAGQAASINSFIVMKYAADKIAAPAKPEAAPEGVLVLSSICPHLGCAVLARDADGNFPCPCHGSKFEAFSGRVVASPSPRGLPQVPVKLEGGQIIVSGNPLEPIYGAPTTKEA